jgi:hypothetical protein
MSCFISSMTHWSLSNVLFILKLFACFLLMFLLLISGFNTLWSHRMHGIILSPYICWGLLYALRYDQFWRRFHGLLRRIYIVQKLDEIIFINFCLGNLSVGDKGVLRSPTMNVLEFIYVLGPSEYVW